MKSRLKNAGLLYSCNENLDVNICVAWSALSQLGCPARYAGKTDDGLHKYVIMDPRSGSLIASGLGETVELSMCEAAINASTIVHTT